MPWWGAESGQLREARTRGDGCRVWTTTAGPRRQERPRTAGIHQFAAAPTSDLGVPPDHAGCVLRRSAGGWPRSPRPLRAARARGARSEPSAGGSRQRRRQTWEAKRTRRGVTETGADSCDWGDAGYDRAAWVYCLGCHTKRLLGVTGALRLKILRSALCLAQLELLIDSAGISPASFPSCLPPPPPLRSIREASARALHGPGYFARIVALLLHRPCACLRSPSFPSTLHTLAAVPCPAPLLKASKSSQYHPTCPGRHPPE